MSLESAKKEAGQVARAARGWIVPLARSGFAAKGVVNLTIGILAALAAFKGTGRTTDSQGALEEILGKPYGRVLLCAVTVGLAGYAIWRYVQAFKDTEDKGSDAKGLAIRVGYAAIGLLYTGLAYSAVRMIVGAGSRKSGDQSRKEWTAVLLAQPFGRWLVGVAGLGVIAFALYQFYKAYTTKFADKLKKNELDDKLETMAIRFGQVGLTARGIVFGITGLFLIQAAYWSNPGEAEGLGGALRALEQQPFGPWVLGVVALGLMSYGLYMFVMALYRRIKV